VTTAVQAGWKMLGEKETPQLNFHEETKLLIAVGEPTKLELIDSVLAELGKALPPGAMRVPDKPGNLQDVNINPAAVKRVPDKPANPPK
jgi:hypothetical protein